MGKRVNKLDLYRLAVQHPEAEVSFLLRCYEYYRKARQRAGGKRQSEFRGLLKEDFCGGCALAAAWVGYDEYHQAMGVDLHGPTLRWADKKWGDVLGDSVEDLHLVEADVMEVIEPKVDVINASNFSIFYYHDRKGLLDYFRSARKSLRSGGILAVDAYGGPGAMVVSKEKRVVEPDLYEGVGKFVYEWDQRSYNAVTGRVDCRIHFEMADGKRVENAFRYGWRLWSLAELRELMLEAGFTRADVWCDDSSRRDGRFVVTKKMDEVDNWVAYVVGAK